MDELILRILQGTANDAEAARVRAWRGESDANERRYRELSRLWELTGAAESRAMAGPAPSAREIVRAARSESSYTRIRDCSTPTAVSHSRPRHGNAFRWSKRGVAAAALIVMGLGLGEFVVDSGETRELRSMAVVTGVAERATVRLDDGSIVRLAPESRLSVTGDNEVREVWVDGRAFFSVVKRDDVPFVVRTRAGAASVLGTRFAVDIRADSMRVTVIEGSVALSAGREQVEVRAGQASTAVGGRKPSVSEPIADDPELEWMGRFLAFQATPLSEVVRSLERHFDIRVEILGDSLAGRTVTAWFSGRSVREVLTTVCRVAAVHCTLNDGVATIQP